MEKLNEQISYAGVILWTFPSNNGGCLSDVGGTTYLFHSWDRRNYGVSRAPVYTAGFAPQAGELVLFNIEFGNDFGTRCNYRITSLAPLAENEAHPDDLKKLKGIFDDFVWERAVKRGRKRGYVR